MTNEQTKMQDRFHAFLKQRNSKTNAAMKEAQRLVNLYRVLNVFGSDFVQEYNKMLLNAPDEVHMNIKALVGGVEVRQYLEFLQAEAHQEQSDSDNSKQEKVGWLPLPQQETPAQTQSNAPAGDYVSGAEWNAFIRAQEEQLSTIMETLRAEQNAALTRLMNQMSGALNAKQTPVQKPVAQPTPQYSEIIEEKR